MEFIIILFLLILNGIFAMYEIALVSSSKARLETLVSKGNKSAKGVLKQLEEPEKFLSTIQIGITLIGIISGAYGGVAIADDVTPLFAMIPGLELYAKDLAMVTTVAVITYLSLIIGELVPKSMALNNPERYATLLSPFMIILTKVSYPFVCLLSASTKLTNKLIGMKDGEERQMTQEELKMILHQSSEQGVIDKEETEMLRDVFRFSDKRANDLMTHRRDVIVLHPSDTQEEVLRIIQEEHFSKYLLVENGKDEIIGVVSVKDIILMLGGEQLFNLRTIARPPLFIPESLYAKKVLELFKKNKNKFGVVVDEYGNTEGIITLHDLTEDRKGNGLILSNPIKINTTLANLDAISRHTVIDKDKEYNVAVDYKNKLNTKCPTVEQNVGNLSGGNQQKVLLAKWMFTDPDILILDEPTRGIDVGAKYEIYCIINQLVAEGKSVIMISSELPEILGMCDRIYVMNEGKIVGELAGSEATQELIMSKILSAGKKGALA